MAENVWDRVIKNFKEGATASAEKIELYARLGKVKIDVVSVKRRMDAVFSELGGAAYGYLAKHPKNQLAQDEKVKGLMDQLKDLEKELTDLETNMDDLKKAAPQVRLRRSDDLPQAPSEKGAASKDKKSSK